MSAVRKLALFGWPIGAPVIASTSSGARPVVEHLVDADHHRVRADAVADEVRRVLADDDALAEHVLAEAARSRASVAGVGLGPDDELEELHVADGVEEVHHEEALLERSRCGPSSCRRCAGPRCSTRRSACAGSDLLELLEERLLDVELLDDGLDDEVAVGELLEVVLDVARSSTRRARALWKNAAGRALTAFSRPPAAKRLRAARSLFSASVRFGGTMSSSTTSMPALARCAAMPLPITPAPMTPTLRMTVVWLMRPGTLGPSRPKGKARCDASRQTQKTHDSAEVAPYLALVPIRTSTIFEGVAGGSPRTMFGRTSSPLMALPHTVYCWFRLG